MIKKYIGIFQGGGIKAIAFLGALKCLEENDYILSRGAGTSAGAIIASLMVARYSANDLINIVMNPNFKHLFIKNNFLNVVNKKFWIDMHPFWNYISYLLERQKQTKFIDVYQNDDFNLKINATSTKYGQKLELPKDLIKYGVNPFSFSIVEALKMSSHIPFVFSNIKIHDDNIYDGGFVENIPLVSFKGGEESKKIYFTINKNNFQAVDGDVININVSHLNFLKFNINNKIKSELIEKGYLACRQYLSNIHIRK